ncbi:MAG: hypothetical protein ACFFKA_19850 [Candidatus Thorarchaeota archaeon]
MADKKTIIIVVLTCLVLLFGYFAYREKPHDSSFAEKYLKEQMDSLANENTRLLKENIDKDNKILIFSKTLDSLQNLEPKVIIKYVKKYKEIDSASAGELVNDFNNLFPNTSR